MSQDEPSGPDLDGVVADANAVGLSYASHLRVNTRRGIVDILRGGVPPLDYETVAEHARVLDIGGQSAPVAGLRSIVGFKRLAGRPRDRNDLEELEAFHGELPIDPIPASTHRRSKASTAAGTLHHHLGTQISHIESGTLTYTVRRGVAVVREGEADQGPRWVHTIVAGQTARIRPGQWLVEQPSDIHEAANRGSTPVVIYLATLLKTGAPPATPVELP